ncbi:hypothetical protein BGZ93_003554 [Podila epicladia]|nr:hypothetical protein BGZ93_003554 [Podila epicladia]
MSRSPARTQGFKKPLPSPRKNMRLSLSDLALPSTSVASSSSCDSSEIGDTDFNTPQVEQHKKPQSEPIKTFLRLKPGSAATSGYIELISDCEIRMTPESNSRKPSSAYRFTKVLGPLTTQKLLFEESCFPMLPPVLLQDNFNALIFAYGASNSGKSHSVLGSGNYRQAGILPRALAVIFKSIERYVQDSGEASQYRPVGYQDIEKIDPAGLDHDGVVYDMEHKIQLDSIEALDFTLGNLAKKLKMDTQVHSNLPFDDLAEDETQVIELPAGMDYTVWLSCSEIYADKIYDLLAPVETGDTRNGMAPKRPALFLKNDLSTGCKYVHGLKEIKVKTLHEALLVLRAGLKQRQVFSTLQNKTSSRSHCVFTIKVLKTPQFGGSAAEDAAKGKTSLSRISIVDLAGSERMRVTQSSGQRLKEAGDINNSIMVLGHCMETLRANQLQRTKKTTPVPYHLSKLTQLFQTNFEDRSKNSQVAVLVNVNPSGSDYEETIQTLRFSSTAIDVTTPRHVEVKGEKPSVQTPLASSQHTMEVDQDTEKDQDTHQKILSQEQELVSLRQQVMELDPLRQLVMELEPLRQKAIEIESLRQQVMEIGPLRQQIVELEPLRLQVTELEVLREHVCKLEPLREQVKELESLRRQVKDYESLREMASDLESLRVHNMELEALVEKNKKLEELRESTRNLQVLREQELEIKAREQAQELQSLRGHAQAIQLLQEEVEELRPLQEEVKELRPLRIEVEELRSLRVEVEELRPLRAQMADIGSLQQEVEELRSFRDQVKESWQLRYLEYSEELELLREQVKELEPLRKQTRELDPLRVQVNELEPLREQIKELDSLRKQIEYLQSVLAEKERQEATAVVMPQAEERHMDVNSDMGEEPINKTSEDESHGDTTDNQRLEAKLVESNERMRLLEEQYQEALSALSNWQAWMSSAPTFSVPERGSPLEPEVTEGIEPVDTHEEPYNDQGSGNTVHTTEREGPSPNVDLDEEPFFLTSPKRRSNIYIEVPPVKNKNVRAKSELPPESPSSPTTRRKSAPIRFGTMSIRSSELGFRPAKRRRLTLDSTIEDLEETSDVEDMGRGAKDTEDTKEEPSLERFSPFYPNMKDSDSSAMSPPPRSPEPRSPRESPKDMSPPLFKTRSSRESSEGISPPPSKLRSPRESPEAMLPLLSEPRSPPLSEPRSPTLESFPPSPETNPGQDEPQSPVTSIYPRLSPMSPSPEKELVKDEGQEERLYFGYGSRDYSPQVISDLDSDDDISNWVLSPKKEPVSPAMKQGVARNMGMVKAGSESETITAISESGTPEVEVVMADKPKRLKRRLRAAKAMMEEEIEERVEMPALSPKRNKRGRR